MYKVVGCQMEIIKARRNRAFWNCPFHGKLFTSALRCNQTEIYKIDYKIAPNSLTHLLDYIVMQLEKLPVKKAILNAWRWRVERQGKEKEQSGIFHF